ncbi:hypothetical protein Tco_0213893 [Tanacetum coccineum]
MEIDTTPSSPTLMMSAAVVPVGDERRVVGRPQVTIPLNPTSNITSNSQTHLVTPVHPDMQTVDEAFVMANYSQLEPLIEDVDEEREKEAPLGFQSQPPKDMEGQNMQGIPPLLTAHLRETKRKRRTLSPREAPIAHRSPAHGDRNPNQ